MFTGIVEVVGRVVAVERGERLARIGIEAPEIAAEVAVGDSVAVNGTCLTVTGVGSDGAGRVDFDVILESLERTSLGQLREGSGVNLERAMRLDGRLDGHIVQGHVDETGKVRELRREGEDVRLVVDCSPAFSDYLVEKGSVAIDGVALTVVGVEPEGFDVALIPHTLEITTLGGLAPGTPVNLEADVLGKYVKRYLERILPAGGDGPGRDT